MAAQWSRRLAAYSSPSLGRSLFQLISTGAIFAGLWYLMLQSLAWPWWTTILLAFPTAGVLIRLFIIQHDCGHGSFFKSKRASTIVGSAIGVMTLTPYHYWKKEHSIHHATSGLLDKRGHGDIDTLTVREYRELSAWKRFLYRLYRSPVVLFGIGPLWQFLINHRLPLTTPPSTKAGWISIVIANVATAGILVLVHYTIGLIPFLKVQVPITLISCTLGVWLFYVQHQFEGTYWRRKADWDYADAALLGSSHYDLGRILQWFTGNIGLHHIHHLNSRIPNYRLQKVLNEFPDLRKVTRIGFFSSLKCLRLALWDEDRQKLVGFGGARG
jgi:omega-6 fatty acid desaturase (delta-12 desaturase)